MANRQIGALWQKKSQSGTAYLSGYISLGVLGERPVVIFKAMDKRTDSSPDMIVYASTPQRPANAPDAETPKDDDDLPF